MQNFVISFINKYRTMWRWLIVGITTAVIDYFSFISMYPAVNSVLIANFCAGLLSITFNYFAHYFWSFKSEANHLKSGIRFLLNIIIIWVISTLLLKVLISAGIEPRIAKLIPMLLIAPLNFLSLRFFVYKKKPV